MAGMEVRPVTWFKRTLDGLLLLLLAAGLWQGHGPWLMEQIHVA